jgi:HSP20 family protein
MAEERKQERRPVRWDPFGNLELFGAWAPFWEGGRPSRLLGLMDELMGERRRPLGTAVPPMDVTEAEDHYLVTAELPGVRKDDLTVELQEGVLSIRGEKKSEREDPNQKGRWLERSFGTFSRSFTLPSDANTERLDARFEDGVLRLRIEKKPEAKPKTIAIKG